MSNHKHQNEDWGNRTNFNSSKGENLKLSEEAFIGLTVLYTLTTVLAIVGNIFVVIVFKRGKRSRTDLRPFLINLAIADLLMAVFCMPFTFADAVYRMWIFSPPLCPIVLFTQIFSVAASVFTNVAIAVDRFFVVTYPLKHRFTQDKSKYVIFVIWVAASVLAAVQFFVARVHMKTDSPDGHMECDEDWFFSPESRRIYTIAVLMCTYIIPLVIISVAYSIVGFLLWKRTPPGNKDRLRDFLQWRSKIKVVKMLVLVVTMFGVCWLPLHVFIMVSDFHPHTIYPEKQQNTSHHNLILGLYLSFHWLAMSNSFANPIIYSFTNESFRADLLTLIYQWCPCCTCLKLMINRTYSITTKESILFRRYSNKKKMATKSLNKASKRFMIVEQKTGLGGQKSNINTACDKEELDLVCKLFVDGVSELETANGSSKSQENLFFQDI